MKDLAAPVILIGAVVVGLILLRLCAQNRTAARIRISSAAGIHTIEKILLGGVDQWIQIRGVDQSKPVLLFLHGGPGFPEMPFAHLNAALAKDFMVVHWDQRGAGKSYSAPKESLDVEQFVSDARELTDLLLKRFGAEKLFLVGHSWGSLIGALTAARNPDRFFAYVGISQFANAPESERIMYRFALEQAERRSNAPTARELKQIGPPPYQSMRDFRTMKKWVNQFSKDDYRPMSGWQFARFAFASPAYSWRDLANLAWGARISFDELGARSFTKRI